MMATLVDAVGRMVTTGRGRGDTQQSNRSWERGEGDNGGNSDDGSNSSSGVGNGSSSGDDNNEDSG